MRFLFARRKETKGDPPSLQSSSDESSKSGESEEAVLTSGIAPSSSSPMTSLIKASPQRSALTSAAAASSSASRKAFAKTPSRNGYSFVAEAKAEEKTEEVMSTTKSRFGFVRLVSRVRTRSFGPPKDDAPYAPPPPELEPLVPPPEARPTSPTAELWKKLFGSTVIPPEQAESPESSKRTRSKSIQRRFKVTVEDGLSKQQAPLLRPPPQPTLQQAQKQLLLSQQHQQQQQEQEQEQQSSSAANERHVHYRDEVSEISANEFTASFIYDDDDDDFNDETSRSVATGTSSISLVSDRTGTTGDSTFTDMSGYTSTVTEPVTEGEVSNTTPRLGGGASRFGSFRCDGVGNDIDDDESGRPQQGLAEGLIEDVKSVLTDLARDILCLANLASQKKGA